MGAGIITSRVAPLVPGDHDTGVDVDHAAITVELCPFLDTPNNGGEYKVWVTPVADFVGNPELVDNGYSPGLFHGFVPAASKTDNFKIRAKQAACLTVVKFIDSNGNGQWDTGEPRVVWPIVVRDPLGTIVQGPVFTGDETTATKPLKICSLPTGTYIVDELQGEGWSNTYTGVDGKKIATWPTVTLTMQGKDRTVVFGNKPSLK